MKAVVIEEFGGSDKLKLTEVPDPVPAAGEVLIENRYAGVNPVDWKIREGGLQAMLPHSFPLILGWDAAGTVKALGEGVSGFQVGDKVYAYCRKPLVQWGTYAELVAMDASAVAPLPDGVDLRDAAGIPLVALTAWQALFDFGGFGKGKTILVHGGAGGVGGYGIQFARVAGAATVYTTASAANTDYVRELGADVPIDYRATDFAEVLREREPDGVDMVFDCVGGETLEKSYGLVKKGGVLASIVAPPDEGKAAERDLKSGFVFVEPNGEQLRRIAALIGEKKVTPLPVEELPLEKAKEALDRNQERHVRGKLVLKIR